VIKYTLTCSDHNCKANSLRAEKVNGAHPTPQSAGPLHCLRRLAARASSGAPVSPEFELSSTDGLVAVR